MKKNVLKLLSITLCGLFILSACGSKDAKETGTVSSDKTETQLSVTKNGEFPVVNEEVTYTAFIGMNRFVENLDTNKFTNWYADKTKVNFKWEQVPVEQIEEKRNVLMASGDYPDVFINARFTQEQISLYGNQGIFIKLNDLIDTYNPELSTYLNNTDYSYIKDTISDTAGSIYNYPRFGDDKFHMIYPRKMWIYKPWLEKLNLEMPTTTEEFEKVLLAFKNQDPNGNNKKDEIPLAGAISGWEADATKFLMQPFQSEGNNTELILEKNRIDFVPDNEGFRDGLRYMKKLYDQGLLAPESFTQTNKQLRQLGENPDDVILGVGSYGWFGGIALNNGESGRYKDYVAMPPLEGPTGLRQTYELSPGVRDGLIISDKAKNPEILARWVDWFYTLDGSLYTELGFEGDEWVKAEPGSMAWDGGEAYYKQLVSYGEVSNITVPNMFPLSRIEMVNKGVKETDPNNNEARLFNVTKELYAPYGVNKNVPHLNFSTEDTTEIAQIKSSLLEFVTSAKARFITGDMDLDKDWEAYKKELKSRGSDRYVEIYQKYYDVKFK